MKDMTKGSPAKLILLFAGPILMGSVLQLTYSFADTRIVGSYLGEDALAAVGSTAILSSLLLSILMGFANGFAIMIAQKFGAKDEDGVKRVFAYSFVLGILITIFLTVTFLLGLDPILHFLNIPQNLMKASKEYISIIIVGMIVTMLYDILMASMRSIGDSITPLLILGVSVVLNIVGDLFLIVKCDTGIWGASAATVGAQLIALVVCAIYMICKYELFHLKLEHFKCPPMDMIKNMLTMGLSMALSTTLVNIGTLILQTAINSFGQTIIVAHTSARKLTELLMSVYIVIGQAMATYCGQNLGAGEYKRILDGIKVSFLYSAIWTVFVVIFTFTLSPMMIHFVTGSSNPGVLHYGSLYLKFDTSFYIIVSAVFILRNSLLGIGDKVNPLISSGLELVGKIIMTLTVVPIMGYWGVIIVEPIMWIIMVIPLFLKLFRDPIFKTKDHEVLRETSC